MKNKQEILDVLRRTMLFKGVSDEALEDIITGDIGRLKEYRKGELLIHTGDEVDAISIVLKGTVLVTRLVRDGHESTVHVLKERKCIGIEYARESRQKSIFDYSAVTDVEIYSFKQRDLMDKSRLGNETADQLMHNILALVRHENLRQHQKLYILSMGSLRNKLLAFLYYEYAKTNCMEFDISFNRENLAAYLCVNRSALSRELSQMEKDGLIKTKGKHFLIKDLKAIEEMGSSHGR